MNIFSLWNNSPLAQSKLTGLRKCRRYFSVSKPLKADFAWPVLAASAGLPTWIYLSYVTFSFWGICAIVISSALVTDPSTVTPEMVSFYVSMLQKMVDEASITGAYLNPILNDPASFRPLYNWQVSNYLIANQVFSSINPVMGMLYNGGQGGTEWMGRAFVYILELKDSLSTCILDINTTIHEMNT